MISIFKDIGKGITDYGTATRFIFKNKLAWFFIFPLLFNILLFVLGAMAIDTLLNSWQEGTLDIIQLKDAQFWGADALRWIIQGLMWFSVKVLFFLLFSYLGGYVTLAVMSPVLAFLSEKTEKILLDKNYPFDVQQLMRDMLRGVLIVLRNVFLGFLISIVIFILSWIPILGWIVALLSPFILLIVSAYFYGYSFVDYVVERQRVNLKTGFLFMKQHKGVLIGNGLPFAIIVLLPLGSLLASFVSIISVVASVISVKDDIKKQAFTMNPPLKQ